MTAYDGGSSRRPREELPSPAAGGNDMCGKTGIINGLLERIAVLSDENRKLRTAVDSMSRPVSGAPQVSMERADLGSASANLKAEKTIRFMDKLIETANIMIVGTDNIGKAVIFNAEAERISGYGRGEVIGNNWLEKILPKEMFDCLWQDMKELIVNSEIPSSYENLLITKSGEEKIILWQSATLVDNNSEITHISFGVDITEKKKAENTLKIKSIMLDSIADNVFLIDAAGNIEYANRTITKTHGYTKEEAEKMNIGNLCGEGGAKTITDMIGRIKSGADISFEITHLRKDGSVFPAEIHASKIYIASKVYVLLVGRDITGLKENEARLKELNATKNKLFSIIGHDLKGPVGNAVQLFELIAEEKIDFEPEERERFFKLHLTSLKNTGNLLENLLEWARIQKDEVAVKAEKVNVKKVVEECFELMAAPAADKKIELSCAVDGGIDISADERMFKTIIRNLLSNSVKYCFENGKVEISAAELEDGVQITVSDDGAGMSGETLEKLFRIDKKISVKGTRGETGSGFGLILCGEFAAKNNGSIRAESRPGKGSSMIIRMPRHFERG